MQFRLVVCAIGLLHRIDEYQVQCCTRVQILRPGPTRKKRNPTRRDPLKFAQFLDPTHRPVYKT